MTDPPASPLPPAVDEVNVRTLALSAGVLAGALAITVLACSLLWQKGVIWPWDGWLGWRLRLDRLLSAAAVGAGLAVAGASLQSLLRNALASPFVLGVSSGAGVGVLIGMALFSQAAWAALPTMATLGALGAMAVVYLAAQRRGRLDPYSLLLTGVIVNAFNGAIMLFVYLYAKPYIVTNYVRWAMGAVRESPSRPLLCSAGGLIAAGWVYLFSKGHAYNVQSLGDDVATSSGVNVHWLRVGTFVAASLMTAAAVALAGPIGFVGLIVPHICRMILGADHRRLLIASGFVGAILLVVADTFCRVTVRQFEQELPVGIITAFCGGPFFILLLRRRLREIGP